MTSPLPWSATILPGLARALGDVVASDGSSPAAREEWDGNSRLALLAVNALPKVLPLVGWRFWRLSILPEDKMGPALRAEKEEWGKLLAEYRAITGDCTDWTLEN